ncbi:MAG: CBS domain-containing protein [Proteobacteria bacterium]|jgi:CBS-domain-containing membrane protein|nr:CBS domain-containing protein [Candidatus Fonsibacter sp. PEL5]
MKISLLRDLKNIKENFAFKTETPISEIALALKDKKIGAVPIVDENNKLLGIVSERDIVSKLVVEARDADLTTAKEIMTSKIITAKLDDDINYIIGVMKNNNIRHIPVLDENDRLTDFFSIRDFLKAEMQDNLEIKQKHKNVVRYQIMVSILLIGTTIIGVIFDFFERKNLVVIFSAIFLIIGISAVMTIRDNKKYKAED